MSTLIGIPAEEIVDRWDEIVPLLERIAARSQGRFGPADIVKAVAVRDMQLWAAEEGGRLKAVATTEIVNYPRRRVGRFLATSGAEIREWIANEAIIARWAKSQGCDGMEAIARKGLERIMAPFGWTCTHVVLEKGL